MRAHHTDNKTTFWKQCAVSITLRTFYIERKTGLYMCVPGKYQKSFFLSGFYTLLRRPWAFSRTSGCGASRSPARTLRRTFEPRSIPVAPALGVQSRASWRFFKGLRSALPNLAGPWKNHHSSLFYFCCCVTSESRQPSCSSLWQPRTVYFLCVRVYAILPVVVEHRNQRTLYTLAGQS